MLHFKPPPAPSTEPDTLLTAFAGNSDIDQLAQTVSPDLALSLLLNFAGVELRVPKKISQGHHIAEAIGLERAKLLADYTGGGMIFIPRLHPGLRAMQEQKVKEMILACKPRRVIAVELGISHRQVRRITNRLGLSGFTLANARPKSPAIPPESDFNGGLTGGVGEITTPHPTNTPNAPDGAVLGKHGYVVPPQQQHPQRKEEK